MSNYMKIVTDSISLASLSALFMMQSMPGCKADSPYYLRGDSNTSYAVSANNRFMVYTVTSDAIHNLHQINLKTQMTKTLLNTQMYINHVTITADDTYVLFSATKSASAPCHIYSYNLHTNKLLQLTKGTNSDFYPSYFPFQNRVLFIRSHTLRPWSMGGSIWENFYVCSVRLNGTDPRKEADKSFRNLTGPLYLGKTDNILLCPGTTTTSIALLDTKTLKIDNLLSSGNPQSPVASPDGTIIYYISDKNHAFDYEIWSMKSNGTDLKQLTHMRSYLQDPQMSPRGKYLYFRSDPGRVLQYDVYRMTISTGKILQICKATLFHNNTVK